MGPGGKEPFSSVGPPLSPALNIIDANQAVGFFAANVAGGPKGHFPLLLPSWCYVCAE